MKTECDVNGIDAGGDPIQEESKWQLEILLLGWSFFLLVFFSCCTHWFLLLECSLQGSILNFKICKEENKDYEDLCWKKWEHCWLICFSFMLQDLHFSPLIHLSEAVMWLRYWIHEICVRFICSCLKGFQLLELCLGTSVMYLLNRNSVYQRMAHGEAATQSLCILELFPLNFSEIILQIGTEPSKEKGKTLNAGQ